MCVGSSDIRRSLLACTEALGIDERCNVTSCAFFFAGALFANANRVAHGTCFLFAMPANCSVVSDSLLLGREPNF